MAHPVFRGAGDREKATQRNFSGLWEFGDRIIREYLKIIFP